MFETSARMSSLLFGRTEGLCVNGHHVGTHSCAPTQMIMMVDTVKVWIQMTIPRIEDGNNFGVQYVHAWHIYIYVRRRPPLPSIPSELPLDQ